MQLLNNENIQYSIINTGTDVVAEIISENILSIEPASNYNGIAAFSIVAHDGVDTTIEDITITIDALNDPPASNAGENQETRVAHDGDPLTGTAPVVLTCFGADINEDEAINVIDVVIIVSIVLSDNNECNETHLDLSLEWEFQEDLSYFDYEELWNIMNNQIEELNYLDGIIIIHNGKIVSEDYYDGSSISEIYNIYYNFRICN